MRIVFNLQSVGLGNNGGSRTLIKCAESLKELGCDAVIATSANRYTWHKTDVPIVNKAPKCDVIVATGFGSVRSTLSHKTKTKFYYIRGFEKWQASEEKLLKTYRSLNCIVNSEWLKNYLAKHKIQSDLIYPGLDFKDFYVTNSSKDRENVIGGLFSRRHKTKRHDDVIEIGKRLGYKVLLLNRDIQSPNVSNLRNFYNKIKVWVSPSELEGLHNCPHEAALCGCSLVVTDHKCGGVSDYATSKTALIYSARSIDQATKQVQRVINDDELRKNMHINMLELLRSKIGSREHNMKKMIKLFRKGGKRA